MPDPDPTAEMRRPHLAAHGPSRSTSPSSAGDDSARAHRAAREFGEAIVYAGAPALSPTRYCPPAERRGNASGPFLAP